MKRSLLSKSRNARRNAASKRRRQRPLFELLEQRQLLATDVIRQMPIGIVGDAVREIQLDFSAALQAESARTQSNYRLTYFGANNALGGGDDVSLPVLPQYIDGSTMLRLSTLADLSQWTETDYGFPHGILGDWQLDATTGSVVQSVNGGTTFFVSNTDLIDREFVGQLEVQSANDDDYIGVVFGLRANSATELPDSYYLLAWKKAAAGGAPAGLRLARVSGTGDMGERPDLWSLSEADPHIDILATGPNAGWESGIRYEFRVLQQTSGAISVSVSNAETGASVWSANVSDPNPLGRGKVGFYNFSQQNVRHWNLRSTGSLPQGTYQLEVFGNASGLLDAAGSPIDGNADGTAGGTYVRTFTVDIGVSTIGVDLQSTSDTGLSASDNRTKDNTPTFDIATNRSGLAEVFVDNAISPATAISFGAADTIAWTSAALADGDHTVRVRFTPDLGDSVESTVLVAIDTAAPYMLPGTAAEQAPVYGRTVKFNEPVSSVIMALTDPDGLPVALSNSTTTSDTFTFSFNPQTKAGQYRLASNVSVIDVAGNTIDQDRDGNQGEVGQDESIDLFTVIADSTRPTIISFSPLGTRNSNVNQIEFEFSEAIRSTSLTPEDVQITGPGGTLMTPSVIAPIGSSSTRFTATFAVAISAEGDYLATIGPAVLDIANNPMTAAYQATFNIDKSGPRVIAAVPGGDITATVNHIDVTFNEPINSGSFTGADISLFGPNGLVGGAYSVTPLATNSFRVGFADQRANGSYMLTVGPNVADMAGNLMDQNQDGTPATGDGDKFVHGFNILLPDLTVGGAITLRDSLGVASTQFKLNDLVTVGWSVGNSGALSAFGPIVDRVWLSADATLSSNDMLLGTRTFPAGESVGLGSSYSGSQQVRLPSAGSLAPGSYYVIIETDGGKGVVESNESNNTSSTPIDLVNPPLPDLVAHDIVPSGAVTPGSSFTLNWKIDNTGSEAASGSWTERVYVSNSSTGANRQLLNSFTYNGPIAPSDAPIARSESITLPRTSLNGTVYFVVEVDATNNVVESDENNVFVSSSSTSVPAVLSLSFSGTSVTEGGSALQGTLTRNGDVTAPLTVSLTPSVSGQLTLPSTITIPAGQYSQRFDVVATDNTLVEATQVVLVEAAASGFTNASVPITVIDNDQPRLTLTLPVIEVAEGQVVRGRIVRDIPTSQDLLINVVASDSVQLSVPLAVVLPAGQSTVEFDITVVDDTLVERLASYTVSVSASGHIGDTTSLTVPQNDVPGLTLSLPSMVSEGAEGPTVIGTLTRNVVSSQAIVVELTSNNPLLVGVPVTVTIPAGVAFATFPITVADDDLVNGSRSATITARIQPTAGGAPFAEGAATAIQEVIDNDGPTLFVSFNRDTLAEGAVTSATIRRNTTDLSQPLVVTLQSSDVTELTAPVTATIPAGATSVTVSVAGVEDNEVDGDQVVGLMAKATGFNTGSGSIIVVDIDLADLVVTSLSAPATALTNSSVNVAWTIANNGYETALGTWTERIYISKDNRIGDDTLAGQYTFTGPLNEGQSYDRNVPVKVPNVPGEYWIVVETDVANVVNEGLETNNARITSIPITVNAAYTATVSTAIESAPADTPVLLTGSATNVSDGTPAAFQQVSVHLSVRGTKRVLPAITDAAGNFRVTFNPLPGEGGTYTIGAAHPGLTDAPVQDTFKLVGMRAEPPSAAIEVKEADPAKSAAVTIRNLADVPLTNVTVTVLDAPTNLQVTAGLADGATTISSLGTLALNYAVRATDPSVLGGTFRLRITSNEAPAITVPVSFSVVPLVSRLVADPGSLNKSMLVGDQTSVELKVTNTGGKATGTLNILLPTGADWLSLATPATVPSLGPGESTSITLLLTPPKTLALTAYNGSLVVRGDTTQVSVPFSFRAVSDQTGDLQISVVDEFFYFTAEKPLVTNATVILRDVITGAEIASSANAIPSVPPTGLVVAAASLPPTVSIDSSGQVKFSGVPEGAYTLEVRADKHDTYNNTVRINSGELNTQQVFISRNLVEYTWTVQPVEIEDRTRIVIETVFETNVPAPVVTVEGQIDVNDLQVIGQSQQFDIKITNHGLIAAEDVGLDFGTHPFYEITPLIQNIGVLPAKSEIIVPVIVTRVGDFETPEESAAALRGSGLEVLQMLAAPTTSDIGPLAATSIPCGIPAHVIYAYVCKDKVLKRVAIPVSGVEGNCTPLPFTPTPGGGGGGGGFGGGPGATTAVPVISQPVPCNDCLAGFVKAVVECAVSFIPWTPIANCFINGFQCGADIAVSGLNSDSVKKCVIGGFDCLKGLHPAVKGAICACNILTACKDFGLQGSGFDKVCKFFGQSNTPSSMTTSLASSLRAAATSPTLETQIHDELLKAFAFLEQLLPLFEAASYPFGDVLFGAVDSIEQGDAWFSHLDSVVAGSGDERIISPREEAELLSDAAKPALLPDEAIRSFARRWNRSIAYWDQGIFAASDLPIGANVDFIDFKVWTDLYGKAVEIGRDLDASGIDDLGAPINAARLAMLDDVASYSADGTCAQVRIQIEQRAVQTRTAFDATLQISNSTTQALQNIGVEVVVLDAQGNDATELFGVEIVSISNLGNADGTGVLGANSTGSVKWRILPSTDAATAGPTEYFVAGKFRYTETGIAVERILLPTSITVHPQPELNLDYFLQRDVISDDPHTAEIESAQPFTLAVMVQNNGAGAAKNLRIDSAQPKIVENEKGLLIDFEITGTKVNGGEVQRSLTANFGTVNPGAIAIAEWQMESTLQGLFTDYKVSFQHESPFGDNRFSLIKSAEIHELIHVVDAKQVDTGDGLPDFLVNDLADPDDLPDTLYLSNGRVVNVGLGSNASVDSPPVLGDFRVAVSATMAADWSYLKMEDPSLGDLKLIGVQRSDGTMLPKENFWQTDRTFIGLGQRPVLEDKIHLLDYNSTGSYTFIYSNGDLTGPEVVSFAGVVPNPTTQAIDVVDAAFTERLADATFNSADISLTKNGTPVPLSGVSIAYVSGSNYRISGLAPFTGQDAVYELTVNAAGLTDQVGNPGVGYSTYRWVKGETAPTILTLEGTPSGIVTTGPASIDIVFSKPIVGLDTSDLTLTRGGSNLADAQVTVSQVGDRTYRIGNLARLTGTDGSYIFSVNAAGVQDNVGNAGLGVTTAAWTLDSAAPQLLDVFDPPTNPRNIVVQQIDVEFSEPIDLATFDVSDLKLVRNGSTTNLLAGDSRVTFEARGNNVYRIGGISWVQAFTAVPQIADFTLTVDASGIRDLAGNTGVGVLSSTWTLDLDKPAAASDLVLSTFSGPVTGGKVNARQATVAGTLGEAGLTVVIRDMTNNTDLSRETIPVKTFSLPIEFTSPGQHQLRIRTVDPAGNTTDAFIDNLFVSETPPVVEMLIGLPNDRTRKAVDFVDVKFLAPIVPSSLTKSALMISRNGGSNLVNGTVSILPQSDGRTFRFTGLSAITGDEGRYDLQLDLTGVRNSAGLGSSETRSASWINDHTAPTSRIQTLEFRQDLNSFIIDLVGDEPALPDGIAPSGIAAFDLYYSDNGTPFQLLETLAAETPTTTFIGEPNHIYYFRSVARDVAGNIELKPNQVDAWTYVPDLFAPQTQVTDVDTTDATFEVSFSGTDRGMGLRTIELFAQVDQGAIQSIGTFAAGMPDATGTHHGIANYQAIADGRSHEYRFFTTSIDWNGNSERPPDAPSDVVVHANFAAPSQTSVVDFDVQKGADQRSFIRYLDIFFNTGTQLNDIVVSLTDGNSANDRIRLTQFGLDGGGPGVDVNLNGRVAAADKALALDFGLDGLGGDRTGTGGDGYYKLALDLDGNGSLETQLAFFRLLGDADGDRDADNADLAAVNAAFGQIGGNLNGDLNGDGRVNALDRQAWQRGRGRSVAMSLPLDD